MPILNARRRAWLSPETSSRVAVAFMGLKVEILEVEHELSVDAIENVARSKCFIAGTAIMSLTLLYAPWN